jgi:membrane protease YdiL (CAAX protease family)
VTLPLAVFCAVVVITYLVLPSVYHVASLRAEPPYVGHQAGLLFQSLNEEIFFRGVLLALLVRRLRRPLLTSAGLAAVFAAAHYLLYRFPNPLHVSLSWAALVTLFCVGLAMNNLFLAAGHIGFAWAFHAGWNVIWLPATVFDARSGQRLREPEIFDRMLGTPQMVVISAAAAAISLVVLAFCRRDWRLGLPPGACERPR